MHPFLRKTIKIAVMGCSLVIGGIIGHDFQCSREVMKRPASVEDMFFPTASAWAVALDQRPSIIYNIPKIKGAHGKICFNEKLIKKILTKTKPTEKLVNHILVDEDLEFCWAKIKREAKHRAAYQLSVKKSVE